jgi:hypothetical protein
VANLTDNSFLRLSDPILEVSEALSLSLLERIKRYGEQLIEDPENQPTIQQATTEATQEWEYFEGEAEDWTDEAVAQAYLRGIQETNGQANEAGLNATAGAFTSTPLLATGSGGAGRTPQIAKEILSEYPDHHTMYSVFKEQAYSDFNKTRVPVIRDVEDKVRNLIVEASESSYRNADTFTRRQMTQELMERFADENITGIRYADGRTMNINSYSEMVARSQTGNAAREASMRRAQEYGLDLVQISVHFPCSDLCIDQQGRVYSISGNSDRYPPLEQAISNGLYHVNCKHSQSAYIPGTSKLPDRDVSKTRNKEMYEAQQQQRYNERMVRKWKRRETTALTEDAQRKSSRKVLEWQEKAENHVEANSFLRLKTDRQTIGEAIHPRQRYQRAGIPWKKSDREH